MKAATDGQIDESMSYYQSGFFDIGGQKLYVSRSGFTNELGFEIYCDGFDTDHLALWDHLMSSGKPFGMEFSSTRAMTIRRIEGGILGNTADMGINTTPFEVDMVHLLIYQNAILLVATRLSAMTASFKGFDMRRCYAYRS